MADAQKAYRPSRQSPSARFSAPEPRITLRDLYGHPWEISMDEANQLHEQLIQALAEANAFIQHNKEFYGKSI